MRRLVRLGLLVFRDPLLAFLVFFRCKKPLYYAITVSMAVLIWVVFHFVLNVSF